MADDLLAPIDGEDEQLQLDEEEAKRVLGDSPAAVTGDGDAELDEEALLKDVKTEEEEVFEDDLFDAAIEPGSVDEKPNNGIASASTDSTGKPANASKSLPAISVSSTTSNKSGSTGKRYCCYVSNMTWWTTDVDLESMIHSCDVNDLIDIRFYENRNNGQSKGFALVVCGSEPSIKTITDKLPTKPIHGQVVQVHPYSKQTLAKLDETHRKNDPRAAKISQSETGTTTSSNSNPNAVRIDGSGMPQGLNTVNTGMNNSGGANSIPGLVGMIRAATQAPPYSQPPPLRSALGPPPNVMPTMNLSMNMNMGGGMPNYLRGPPPNMGNPMMRPQNNYNQPPPNMPNMMNPPPLMQGGQNPMGMQMGMGGGYPVMPPQGYPMQQFGGPPPTHMEQPISDHEFEEIMQRNHIVCSTAISRAVSDAATGDYRSAVETLLTAVSLIRQSRTAKHDRCKALISSLEDTIRGIESKQYSSSSSRKHRRSRSRSPDSRSRKHRRRSRSRSHDRYDYSPRRTSRY